MATYTIKTDRGWELCDANGILESLETSIVYSSKHEAQQAADHANFVEHGFDELSALESLIP